MVSTQKYLGAITPFGTIVYIDDRVYNASATVQTQEGSTKVYRLPYLIALGVTSLVQPSAPQVLAICLEEVSS